MKNISVLIVLLYFFLFNGASQTVLSNNADTLHIDSQALLYIEGDFINQVNGEVNNYGEIYMSGDWSNNSSNYVFYPSSTGVVRMYGTSTQNIMGLNSTEFYNLILDGGVSTKNMLIGATVKNQLNLMDAELQTNDNIMYVSNANPNSILWSNGFVSSNDLGGYLSRLTNSASTYIYPVGSYSLSNIYRGVEITPQTLDSNVFAVRLAPVDPSYDYMGMSATGATGGFDRSVKTTLVGNINDMFYHNISRLSGTSAANVKVNYFSSDGDYETMAQWQDVTGSWDLTDFVNVASFGAANLGFPDMEANVVMQNDFNHDLFALSNITGVSVPQFISPNGDGKNDLLVIDNIVFFPKNKIEIFNRYGSLVYSKKAYDNSWDGSVLNSDIPAFNFNQGSLPSGTYFYVLNLGDDNLKPVTGYIQIQK